MRHQHRLRTNADGELVLAVAPFGYSVEELGGEALNRIILAQHHVRATVAGADRSVRDVHDRAADELRHEQVDGMLIDVVGQPDLLQDAVVHDGDPVGHGHGLDLVVGDVDGRGFVLDVNVLQLGPHLLAQLGVERADRLVHQQRLGPAHERSPDGDALHVAAGQGRGPFAEQPIDAQRLGHLAHALIHDVPVLIRGAQRKRNVLVGGQMRIEGEQLEHEGDIAVGRLTALHRLSVDQNLAAVDFLQAGDGAQRRGLAAAGRSQQHEKLAMADLEVELADDVVVAEILLDVPEDDAGHQDKRNPRGTTIAILKRAPGRRRAAA